LGVTSLLATLALVEAIALAVHLQDVDMVGESVQEHAGEALGAEHLGPVLEGQIGWSAGWSRVRNAG
jgi:hypothetical protein